MTKGTYTITDTVSGKVYHGSSVNLEEREYEHFRTLRKGNHVNRFLQRTYNKRPEALVFQVLQVVPESTTIEQLRLIEQEILTYKRITNNMGFNINPNATGGSVTGWTEERRAKMSAFMKTRIFSPEHRARLSQSQLGNKKSVGRVVSEEVRKHVSDLHKQNGHQPTREAIEKSVSVRRINKGEIQ